MQFIKPGHIQRLLKLKTPEDIREWREERKANFPTLARREARKELRRESSNKFAGERNQLNRENGRGFGGDHRNSKFNKQNKFGRNNHRFNNGRQANHKRPFDANRQPASSGGEPTSKAAKLIDGGEPSNEQDNEEQNVLDKTADSNSSAEQSGPPDDGPGDQQTSPSTSRDNRTNKPNQQNRFKRRRPPTLLEKVSLCVY